MQIIKAKNLGYCAGVRRAIACAVAAREQEGGPIYTLGDLIHNAGVVARLEGMGIHSVATPQDVPEASVCVIRTHGVGRDILQRLEERHVRVIDATCPSVKRISACVAEKESEGKRVLVIGDPTHPEVQGICGWGQKVLAGLRFPDGLDPTPGICYFAVAQTTLSPEVWTKVTNKIENFSKNHSQTLEIFNSICYTTTERVEECRKIASACDAVLVIGDRNSNNTRGLCEVASRVCGHVSLISNVSDLASVAKQQYQRLGILAGASTPDELIMEVINRMEQENKLDAVTEDAVAPVEANEETEVKPAEAPQETDSGRITMADVMDSIPSHVRTLREGMKVKAQIVAIDDTGVSVAIEWGGKNDGGFIAADQMEYDGTFNKENYHVGDVLDVMVVPKTDSTKSKIYNLSKRAYDKIKIEDEAVKRILDGEEFRLVCPQVVNGGLLGKLGSYDIFVPASQLRMGYVQNLEEYATKTLRLKKLPDREEEPQPTAEGEGAQTAEGEAAPASAPVRKRKRNPKRIVASQRVILEAEKQEREDAFWETMQVNNIIKGKVKRITTFGAFVSVMGRDCLAHISDLSWVHIERPEEVLELNKTYEFVVLKADRENNRVSLGYKQLQKRPYELAAEKYHVGDVVTGRVERIKEFGAFISLEPGVDGMVHISQISTSRIEHVSDVLKVGDIVEAKIKKFDKDRITLSIRELIEDREAAESAEAMEEAQETKRNNVEKFNKRAEAASAADHKERKGARKDREEGEHHEYVAKGANGATMASLFKDLDISQFSGQGSEQGAQPEAADEAADGAADDSGDKE